MFRRSLVFSGFLAWTLISAMVFMLVFTISPLSGIVHGSAVNDDSATVRDRFLGKDTLELHGTDNTQSIMTFAVTGGAIVKVPLLTEMTAGVRVRRYQYPWMC